jgi:hypothetical protein
VRTRAPCAVALLTLLAACSAIYESESVWELSPIADAAQRAAAAQRMAALLVKDPETSTVVREGNAVRVTLNGKAAEEAWKNEGALMEAILAPPVLSGWVLRVKTRLVTIDGVRWYEAATRAGELRRATMPARNSEK